jgi:hypothetical protein
VVARTPQHGIQIAKEAGAFVVPAPPEIARDSRQTLVHGCDELTNRPRLADDGGELGAGRCNLLYIPGAEGACFSRLHDEHALKHLPIDNRDAQKCPVRVLTRVAKVLESRMGRRVVHHDGPQLFGDQADEALGQTHAHTPDALRPQPDRGRKDQVRAIRLQQVDRAHIGGELPVNQD